MASGLERLRGLVDPYNLQRFGTERTLSFVTQDDWSNTHFVGLIVVVGIVVTVATVLPVWWVWKLLIVFVASPIAFLLVSLFSAPIRRLATFLFGIAKPGPPFRQPQLTFHSGVRSTVIRAGAREDDPAAARVISEYLDGSPHVEEVLPHDADVELAMKEVTKRLKVPVKSVRAMRGMVEVGRWTPGLRQRIRAAWEARL
jgi:hypothetical protein